MFPSVEPTCSPRTKRANQNGRSRPPSFGSKNAIRHSSIKPQPGELAPWTRRLKIPFELVVPRYARGSWHMRRAFATKLPCGSVSSIVTVSTCSLWQPQNVLLQSCWDAHPANTSAGKNAENVIVLLEITISQMSPLGQQRKL